MGKSFSTAFGGKGANQAVALSRLCGLASHGSSGSVYLAGKTGSDLYGKEYREHLIAEGMDIRYLGMSNRPTGTALIEIDDEGTNRIVVVPGANGDIDIEWWKKTLANYGDVESTLFLFQLELPVNVIATAIGDAHSAAGIVILDPAPAAQLPDNVWASLDFITPNQTETAFYTGIVPRTDEEAKKAAQWFFDRGTANVIIKAGGDGSWLFTKNGGWFCSVFPVNVRDTTAAGDSFNAGFAYALGTGKSPGDSLRFANAVGALSTTKAGAQDAMPDLSTVEALLQAWPKIVPRPL